MIYNLSFRIRILAPVVALLIAAAAPANAQNLPVIDAERGTILIHGNYCGPGNRAPRPPVDDLDVACMNHDRCSPPRGQIATCSCNDRLHREAKAVAQSASEPESVRSTAEFIAETALALPCR